MKRAIFSISVAKYRPHRPHCLQYVHLQDFLAGGTAMSYDRHGKDTDRNRKSRPRIDCLEMRHCAGFSPPR